MVMVVADDGPGIPPDAADALLQRGTRLDESTPGQAFRIVQNGCMSLSEAVESVRRSTDGRIVSAETRTSGGRKVHYIKVLTKDGKVKTHKIPGC